MLRSPFARSGRRAATRLVAVLCASALAALVSGQTRPPTPEPRCTPLITVDAPAAGGTVRGPATLSGWALDLESPRGSGADAVHVYLDGEAGAGVGVGVATVGLDRQDVDSAYRRVSSRAGWSLAAGFEASSLGGHVLFVYAHTRCGWTFATQVINVAPDDGWALLNPPPARNSHTAVWDPTGAQMLVLGGRGGAPLSDLWSYRPGSDTWTPLSPAKTPGSIFAHSALWDPTTAQMLVFGGYRGEGRGASGLWSYQPSAQAWAQLVPDGPRPPARGYHTAVWDPTGDQMLVYGGLGGRFDFFGDLWSFRPQSSAWARLEPPGPGPEPRFFHSAVWDPMGSQMLVFGGAAQVDDWFLNDLWSYRPATKTWTSLTPAGPTPPRRLAHGTLWDPAGAQMLVFFGGCGGCYLDDVWSYRPSINTWTQLTPSGPAPAPRGGHSAVWDPMGGQALIYGGGSLNDLWAYRPTSNSWVQLGSTSPLFPAVASHRVVWDATGEQLLVFGGVGDRDGKPANSLWSYRPSTNSWARLIQEGPTPSARIGHSMVWDSAGGQALVFGGTAGERTVFDDLWSYRPLQNGWTKLDPDGPVPTARAFHTAVWDASGGQMMLFGGQQGDGTYVDDLWIYRAASNRWTLLEPPESKPSARLRHTAVWDPAGGQMLVFGGYRADGGYANDLWSYRPAAKAWTEIVGHGPAPPVRARHGAAWDPGGGQMLVFGGYVGGVDYLGDLWSYQPATNVWTRLGGAGLAPPARGDHSALWSPASSEILVFGGSAGDLYNELWSYRPASTRPAPPLRGGGGQSDS